VSPIGEESVDAKEEHAWTEICKLEPKLRRLYDEIDPIANEEQADARWYGYDGQPGVKAKMNDILAEAWRSKRLIELSSGCEVYDIAYEALYQRLTGYTTGGKPAKSPNAG
jgi:hypothetical protein